MWVVVGVGLRRFGCVRRFFGSNISREAAAGHPTSRRGTTRPPGLCHSRLGRCLYYAENKAKSIEASSCHRCEPLQLPTSVSATARSGPFAIDLGGARPRRRMPSFHGPRRRRGGRARALSAFALIHGDLCAAHGSAFASSSPIRAPDSMQHVGASTAHPRYPAPASSGAPVHARRPGHHPPLVVWIVLKGGRRRVPPKGAIHDPGIEQRCSTN